MSFLLWRAVAEQVWNYFVETSAKITDIKDLPVDYVFWLNRVQQ